MSPEQRLLEATGLHTEVLDSGCCGLAGSFGYEPGHHELSMTIGNQVLLPTIRQADPRTLVVSDGFSCRQQIAHGSPRSGMHIAEVLSMALKGGSGQTRRKPVETGHIQPKPGNPLLRLLATAGLLAITAYAFTRQQSANRTASSPANHPR